MNQFFESLYCIAVPPLQELSPQGNSARCTILAIREQKWKMGVRESTGVEDLEDVGGMWFLRAGEVGTKVDLVGELNASKQGLGDDDCLRMRA